MTIAGENGNLPSGLASWPHCCVFLGDTCDGLRWSAMFLKALNRKKITLFIAVYGWALSHAASDAYKLTYSLKIKNVIVIFKLLS